MVRERPRSLLPLVIVGIAVGYALLLLIAPLVAIVQNALADGLQPVIDTLTEPNVVHALEITFAMTVGAVIINTVFGLITAWVLVRQRFLGKTILNTLVDIPFVFSPVIAGYALIVLFGRNGWLAPSLIPIVFALPGILLAKTFVSLPFVTREVGPVLETLEPEPEQAAYVIGASQWKTFRAIIFPEIWPGLLYGIVLTLARALGEFGAVAVVSGGIEGRTETATMFVFRALSDRNDAAAYSVSLLLGLIAVFVLVALRLVRRGMKSSHRKG